MKRDQIRKGSRYTWFYAVTFTMTRDDIWPTRHIDIASSRQT